MDRIARITCLALAFGLLAGRPGSASRAQPTTAAHQGARIMEFEELWEVSGPGSARLTVRVQALVENENGRDAGNTQIAYDTFTKVSEIRGAIRNPDGSLRRKLDKKKDVEDLSALDDISLYDDARMKVVRLVDNVFPYIVEYEYRVTYAGLINWPTWTPYNDTWPVDRAWFTVRAPLSTEVRYSVRGGLPDPVVSKGSGMQELTWRAGPLDAFEREFWGPAWQQQVPHVVTGPVDFEIDDYAGKLSSWAGMGAWYDRISSGQRTLPEAFVRELRAATTRMDTLARARYVYSRLQDVTRYVSVQLGIGSWRPMSARYVMDRGYGDCKALTNYLQAMLEAVDVRARPVLIRSGFNEAEVPPDFPRNAFNHAILMVPTARDTVWLESTSQKMPFDHIGPWNEDRNALVVEPGGGKLVRTPSTPASGTRQLRSADIRVNGGGAAVADIQIVVTGNQQDVMLSMLVGATPEERLTWLRSYGGVGTYDVASADFSGFKAREPIGEISYRLDFPRLASRMQGRLFVPLNVIDRSEDIPPEMVFRTQPVYYTYAFLDSDDVTIHLPDGFTVEALPDSVRLEESFGSYAATVEYLPAKHSVRYRRHFEITQRRIPPGDYPAFREFLAQVVKADRAQFVLSRN